MTEKKEIKTYKREMGDLLVSIACVKVGRGGNFEALSCCLDGMYDDMYDKYCDLYEARYGEQPPCEQARVAYNQAVGRAKAAEKEKAEDDGANESAEPSTKIGFYHREIEKITDELAILKAGKEPEYVTAQELESALDKEYDDLFSEYCRLVTSTGAESPYYKPSENDKRVVFYQSNISQLVERLGCLKSGFNDERVESAEDYIKILSKEYSDLHAEYEELKDGAEPSAV